MKKYAVRISAIATMLAISMLSSTAVYATNNTEKGEIISAEAEITNAPLNGVGGESILYQDHFFTIGASPVNTLKTVAIEENGEGTLMSEETYIEGDYKYVDKIYCRQVSSPARSLNYWNWWGTHEVYYELSKDDGHSMHLGTMRIEGTFAVDADQNIAIVVDPDTNVKCTVTKAGTDLYPVIFPSDKFECENDVSSGAGKPRYARITFFADFVKASDVRDRHIMSFTVDSNNKAYVSCNHFPV